MAPRTSRRRRSLLAGIVVVAVGVVGQVSLSSAAGSVGNVGSVRPAVVGDVDVVGQRAADRRTKPDDGRRCRAGRVALTFDDGPSATITPRLLERLRALDVPATFFVVGSRVAEDPATVRAIDRAGFEIGNHTYHHPDLTTLGDEQIRAELRDTATALREAGVRQRVDTVRAPYGATDARVEAILREEGYSPVGWNVDSRDWDGRDAATIRSTVVDQVGTRGRDGSTVLHHDGVENSAETLAALPDEVRALRRAGYCFVGTARLAEGA